GFEFAGKTVAGCGVHGSFFGQRRLVSPKAALAPTRKRGDPTGGRRTSTAYPPALVREKWGLQALSWRSWYSKTWWMRCPCPPCQLRDWASIVLNWALDLGRQHMQRVGIAIALVVGLIAPL